MPWTINSPPDVAKNWTKAQQRKCVSAANAVLEDGGSEEDAIFACISAAGKSKTKQLEDEYDEQTAEHVEELQDLINKLFAGAITLTVFYRLFRRTVRRQMETMMLLGLGGQEPTAAQLAELDRRVNERLDTFEGFFAGLERGDISLDRALWRAGLYGFSRSLYVYYTLPVDIALLMPVLPGDDCLGGDLCKCSLRVEYPSENEVHVYWELNPAAESCAVCIAHAVESPFVFRLE